MTGDEMRELRHEIGVGVGVLSDFLDVRDTSVTKWERGVYRIPVPIAEAMISLAQLKRMLRAAKAADLERQRLKLRDQERMLLAELG